MRSINSPVYSGNRKSKTLMSLNIYAGRGGGHGTLRKGATALPFFMNKKFAETGFVVKDKFQDSD